MSGLVEVVEAGLAVTIQDAGRIGYRNIGVPLSGALDLRLMAAANALLGNDHAAPVLEVCLSGPVLKALSGTVRCALAGELGAKVMRSRGQTQKVQPWQTATLFPGDTLRIEGARRGVGYVGISGGFRVPSQLGSCATYVRASLGGIEGRALAVGDHIACATHTGDPWREAWGQGHWPREEGPIRVILGPQEDHFSDEALAAFLGKPFRVTRDSDRMGMRLEGETLSHNHRGAEIVSDGVTPGAIQVPANGQPIILLADCQTSGGYPKIATVVRADLPRLAHLRAGDEIRFAAVDHGEALAALRRQGADLAAWIDAIRPFRPPGVIDESALYCCNIVSGAVRGDEAFALLSAIS